MSAGEPFFIGLLSIGSVGFLKRVAKLKFPDSVDFAVLSAVEPLETARSCVGYLDLNGEGFNLSWGQSCKAAGQGVVKAIRRSCPKFALGRRSPLGDSLACCLLAAFC